MLRERSLRLSLAESCTGGMIGCIITSLPGSSEYFLGSAVTYSNESKQSILGVSSDTLAAHGAVSPETAAEMAAGSLRAYGSDIAASVTGIAGPGGAVEGKPVGTVWMAVTDGNRTVTYGNHFSGSRDEIRRKTADTLLAHIEGFLMEDHGQIR